MVRFYSQGDYVPREVKYIDGRSFCQSSQLGLIATDTKYYSGGLGVDESGNCEISRLNPASVDQSRCWSQNPGGTPFLVGEWILRGGMYERSQDPSNLGFCVPVED